jgi:calcineurin-like phosphoesterase family protein
VAFISDLHVDHHPEVVELVAERAAAADVTALIVGGDISPSLQRLEETLVRLRAAGPRVLFVPGNHDLWSGGDGGAGSSGTPDSRERYLHVFPELCARAGVDYLPEGPVALGGLVVVGQTGWYDYSLRDPRLDFLIPAAAYQAGRFGPLTWSDKRFVVWPGLAEDRDPELAAWMAARLRRDLEAAPRDRPVIVATHMVPFAELVPRRPPPWGFVAGFLGASCLGEAIVAAAAAGAPVVHALCGHTHFRRQAQVRAGERDIPVETSPVGYPREVRLQAGGLPEHVAERLRIVEA